MKSNERRERGFSLIELMITLAIAGILASMAIPGFQRMQLRAKAAEGRSNLAAIRTAEESFSAEYGTYAAAVPTPAAVPGLDRSDWPGGAGFALLGWEPEGEVHYQYAVTLPGGGGAASAYTAEAASDLDVDGALNVWGVIKTDTLGAGVAGTLGCAATGVWDAFTATPTLTETVGPCDAVSGLSVF